MASEAGQRAAQEQKPSARRRFTWLRAADDKLPTTWIAGIGTGLFLAVTAAFGGLNTVAAAEPAALEPGTEHVNAQLAVTVRGAHVDEDYPGAYLDDAERVLVIDLTVTNRWSEPLYTSPGQSVSDAVVVRGLDPSAEPLPVARTDDGTLTPVLQPGLAVPLTLAWTVPADAYAPGETITVELRDEKLFTGSMVVSGQYWDDPVTAATMDLTLTGQASR